MKGRVLIFDTSVLCCWLAVPGKTEAGPLEDRWDQTRIENKVNEELGGNSTFVLPLASLIETGNHIAQAHGERFELAKRLMEYLLDAVDANKPWALFTEQSTLWEAAQLKQLAGGWPKLAASRLSIGDATIKEVADYYFRAGYEVEILTGDAGLKAYQPMKPALIPRRRR